MFGKVTTARKVFVTTHAKDRLRQRAKLFLYQHELDNLQLFIQKDFKTSHLDLKYIFSIFDKHKIETRHGLGSFITRSRRFKYMGKYDKDTDTSIITSVVFIRNK